MSTRQHHLNRGRSMLSAKPAWNMKEAHGDAHDRALNHAVLKDAASDSGVHGQAETKPQRPMACQKMPKR
jgi:hypothetical protein